MERMIEWVGQPSLINNPRVEYALTAGLYTREQERLIRDAARRRVMRVDGYTRRILRTTDLPGLTRDYVWGPAPGTFVIDMPESDALLILGCPDGEQFRDVTPGIAEEDRLLPMIPIIDQTQMVSATDLKR